MKYRIKTKQELLRDDIKFQFKHPYFIRDIEDNPGLVIEIKTPISLNRNELSHPLFRGCNDSSSWLVNKDSVSDYFVGLKSLDLDEDLFRL